jgi:hypothetical protein
MAIARRLLAAAAIMALLVLGVVLGGRALIHSLQSPSSAQYCTVGGYEIDTQQAVVASQMVGTVLNRQLPERAAVLALAGALQESKLRNIASGDGDRDSVGVLQQRPSQGWGTVEQLSDVHFATGAFLTALLKVPNWQNLDAADAIQAVQISADGSAYAQHEPEAQELADVLTGVTPAGVSCTFPTPTDIATPAQVAAAIAADLPVNTPTTTPTTVSVPGAGWASAAWLVCNGDRLGIDQVAYAGQRWTRNKGWKADASAATSAVVATMYTS